VSAADSDPVRRTFEIEDPTNLYFIHPISARLVPVFARLGVTPNAVSLLGMGCGLLAGLSYHFYGDTFCAFVGFALMLAWHVMDGADGQLARLTKTYSELGKVLDGICDYVTFAAVYIGLGLAMSAVHGGWVWVVIAVSGICHALQSGAYELQRQNYNFWGLGRQSAALPALQPAPAGWSTRQRIVAGLNRFYARMQLRAGGGAESFHARFAALLAAQPARAPALRAAYCAVFAPIIRRWGVLCANYRTIGIFLAALMKLPLLYFLFEIFGFSLILVLLLQAQKTQNAAFLQSLGQAEGRREALVPAFQQPGA
jgi:CDP-diacylglycerol--serine O-phosphatidyltransferase